MVMVSEVVDELSETAKVSMKAPTWERPGEKLNAPVVALKLAFAGRGRGVTE
jgi:hypothetical protein